MSKRTEFFFPASAGTHRIHAVQWLPENGVPRAVVQILHGVAEHIGRYEDLADYLTGQGFAVVGNDHPGHGQSAAPGDLGFFAKDEMVEAFANKAFEMAPNTISEVVQTPYGYHIIMVTDRNEAGTLSFEQSKKDIINYLESLDKVSILKNKVEELRKEAKIVYLNEDYNPENIQKKIKEAAAENPELQKTFAQAPVAAAK